MMVGKYVKKSPEYLATLVSGFMAADREFCLSNADDLHNILIEATSGEAKYKWDAKHGQLMIEWMRHRHTWCIGQVLVFNLSTNDFEVWGKTEFEREFKEVN